MVIEIWKNIFAGLLLVVLALASVMILYRGPIIGFLFGAEFEGYGYIFASLSAALPLVALGYGCNALLNSFGDFRSQRTAFGLWAMVSVVIAVPLIWKFGLVGAALAYLISRLVSVFLLFLLFRRFDIPIHFFHSSIIGLLVIAALLGAYILNITLLLIALILLGLGCTRAFRQIAENYRAGKQK